MTSFRAIHGWYSVDSDAKRDAKSSNGRQCVLVGCWDSHRRCSVSLRILTVQLVPTILLGISWDGKSVVCRSMPALQLGHNWKSVIRDWVKGYPHSSPKYLLWWGMWTVKLSNYLKLMLNETMRFLAQRGMVLTVRRMMNPIIHRSGRMMKLMMVRRCYIILRNCPWCYHHLWAQMQFPSTSWSHWLSRSCNFGRGKQTTAWKVYDWHWDIRHFCFEHVSDRRATTRNAPRHGLMWRPPGDKWRNMFEDITELVGPWSVLEPINHCWQSTKRFNEKIFRSVETSQNQIDWARGMINYLGSGVSVLHQTEPTPGWMSVSLPCFWYISRGVFIVL